MSRLVLYRHDLEYTFRLQQHEPVLYIKQAHAAAIEMYIQDHVGIKQDGTLGDLYFNVLLNDWSRFDINKRTKFDASISSGLAIMANNRHLYAPNAKVEKQKLNISISKYENKGNFSKIIE